MFRGLPSLVSMHSKPGCTARSPFMKTFQRLSHTHFDTCGRAFLKTPENVSSPKSYFTCIDRFIKLRLHERCFSCDGDTFLKNGRVAGARWLLREFVILLQKFNSFNFSQFFPGCDFSADAIASLAPGWLHI